jgi:hypothetical protein
MSESKTTRYVPSRTKARPDPGPGDQALEPDEGELGDPGRCQPPHRPLCRRSSSGAWRWPGRRLRSRQRTGGTAPQPVYQAAGSDSGGAGSSFQQCVISRESGGNAQVMNSSGHYGLYQFSASTWAAARGNPADFGHAA